MSAPPSLVEPIPLCNRPEAPLRAPVGLRVYGANRLALALLLVIGSCNGSSLGPGRGGSYRVLFIGNSLTYVNDLPGTLSHMAAAVDDIITVQSVARPNFALIDHVNGLSEAVQVIRQGGWNFVVLQEGPSSLPVNRDTLVLATRLLDPEIRAAGARTALYMVWPELERRNVFDAVRDAYQLAAKEVGGIFLPAGEAWRTAWAADPGLRLYGPDNFHPSELGTYLAALVIYEGLTGHDARALPATATVAGHQLSIPASTVRLLQRAAHETVAKFPQ
jgi:hypothetical protein